MPLTSEFIGSMLACGRLPDAPMVNRRDFDDSCPLCDARTYRTLSGNEICTRGHRVWLGLRLFAKLVWAWRRATATAGRRGRPIVDPKVAGQADKVQSMSSPSEGTEVRVAVDGDHLRWPQQCVCCGEAPETVLKLSCPGQWGVITTRLSWDVPACHMCAKHIEESSTGRYFWWLWVLFLLGSAGHGTAGLWQVVVDGNWNSLLETLGSFAVAAALWVFRSKITNTEVVTKDTCSDPRWPVKYERWYGTGRRTHIFTFRNRAYREAFARANESARPSAY
jgi:hypothetical protein